MNRPLIQPHAPIFDMPQEVTSREYDIVNGKYDFAKNMLILDVEVTDTLTDGTVEKRVERRGFEITSLKVRTSRADGQELDAEPLELVGARTDAVMQNMLPAIIRNLNQNVDKKVFFSTAPTGKLTKKTIKFAQDFEPLQRVAEDGQPATYKVNGTTSATDSDYFGDETDFDDAIPDTIQIHNGFSPEAVQDQVAVKALLKYSNFESMIQNLGDEGAPVSEHDVDMSEVIINRHPNIAKLSHAIHTTNHIQAARDKQVELRFYKLQLERFIDNLTVQISEMDQFIEDNRHILSSDCMTVLLAKRRNVENLKYNYQSQYLKAENAINLLKDVNMLDAMYGPEALAQTLRGTAPMSSYLTQQLNEIMVHYGFSFSHEADIDAQLGDILGLNMNLEVTDESREMRASVNDVLDEVALFAVRGVIHDLEQLWDRADQLERQIPISSADSITEINSDVLRLMEQIDEIKLQFSGLEQVIDHRGHYNRRLDSVDVKRFIATADARLIILENRLRELEREQAREHPRVRRRRTSSASTSSRLSDVPGDEEDELARRLRTLRETGFASGRSSETSLYSSEGTVFGTPLQSPVRSPSNLFDGSSSDGEYFDRLAARRRANGDLFLTPEDSLSSDEEMPSHISSVSRRKKSKAQRRAERSVFAHRQADMQMSRTAAEESHDRARDALERVGDRELHALGLGALSEDEESTD